MIELEARLPRKRNLQQDFGPYRDNISDTDITFIHFCSHEVLPKSTRNKNVATIRVRFSPPRVVGGAICTI